jgi:hypothetical protein
MAPYSLALSAMPRIVLLAGVLIVRHHPRHRVGWLLCATGLGNGLFAWSGQYARYALITQPGSVPGGELAFWVNLWAWAPV